MLLSHTISIIRVFIKREREINDIMLTCILKIFCVLKNEFLKNEKEGVNVKGREKLMILC